MCASNLVWAITRGCILATTLAIAIVHSHMDAALSHICAAVSFKCAAVSPDCTAVSRECAMCSVGDAINLTPCYTRGHHIIPENWDCTAVSRDCAAVSRGYDM